MNLTEPMRRVVQERPHAPAFVDGDHVHSFRELWSAIGRTAELLRRKRVSPGDRILVWLPNGARFLAAHFGAMAAGIISVPIKAENGPTEFLLAAGDSKARLLVVERELLTRLPDGLPAGIDLVLADDIPLDGATLDFDPEPVPDDHPGSVIYSYVFGEGRPYGAVLTHGNHLFVGNWCAPFFLIDPGDRILILLPMLHVFPMGMGILPAFYQGASIHLANPLQPRSILETISTHQITHIPGVPQIFEQLARIHRADRYRLGSIKFLTSGADFLPISVHHRIEQALGVPVVQGYGMTETFPTVCNPPSGINRPGTLGIGFHPSIRFRIVDDQGSEQPPGSVGEIEMQTPGAMAGYLDAPDVTARLLHDGWLRSGDLGWVDEHGYLCFDRLRKPIVNVAGNKVDPVEVATTIERLDGVASARVFPLVASKESGMRDVSLTADVCLVPGALVEERDVRVHCRKWLAPYKVPKDIRFR